MAAAFVMGGATFTALLTPGTGKSNRGRADQREGKNGGQESLHALPVHAGPEKSQLK
jgi:hypothetical protein